MVQNGSTGISPAGSSSEIHRLPVVRGVYFSAGVLAIVLAILGALLPVLPTTPFLLVAAACFAKSSYRFYNGLLNHRIAGPIIADWRQYRAMKRETKRWALLLMCLSFGTSILAMNSLWHQLMLLVMAAVLGLFIWRVPVRLDGEPDR